MRVLVSILLLLIPAAALAQPSEPPPDVEPAPPAPSPAPPPPPGPPPPPMGQPAPYPVYVQPPPNYARPAPVSLHNGMTFEANVGIGWVHARADGNSDTSDLGLGGLDIGVGGWLNPRLAITARIAGVTLSENDARLTSGLLAGSLQYWVDDHFWVGGGAGIGVLAVGSSGGGTSDSTTGFGLDLRVGYTFPSSSENTFNVSLELTPTFLSENNQSATLTGVALLVGYQHL